jgi:hypothetical protein
MAPLLTIHGYTGHDPLDRAPEGMRFVLTMAVCALLTTAFLYVANVAMGIYTFREPWMFWVGCAVFTFVWGPILTFMRKASSLVITAMLLVPVVLLEIYLQAQFRDLGLTALWMYNPGTLLSDLPPLVRFLAAWSLDAVIMGPLALWLARLAAGAIYRHDPEQPEPTVEQQRELFPKEWTAEDVTPPQRDVSRRRC